jgi:hypothetical protein
VLGTPAAGHGKTAPCGPPVTIDARVERDHQLMHAELLAATAAIVFLV